MPQEHRPVRARAAAPGAPLGRWRRLPRSAGWHVPGWLGRLAIAGAAAGLVLAHGAWSAWPAAGPGAGGVPGEPAVLLAGAAPAPAGDAAPRVVAAASTFLASLDDTQRAAATFSFDDTTAKGQWSNFPSCCYPWLGVRMGDLSAAQQQLVWDLLTVTLGQSGTQRVQASVDADEQLRIASPGDNAGFGAANDFVAVFGTPSPTAPWMFRFGGHHFTVNATVVGPNITVTPSFPGCQPCQYDLEGQTVRAVGPVADRAFVLLNALDASQQAQAVLGPQGMDLVLGPGQPMRTVAPEGIRAAALTPAQQGLFLDLVGQYVGGLLNAEDAAPRMAEVRSGLADTYFAWAGPTATPGAAYFRVQAPALWIEFSPQAAGGRDGGPQGGPPGGGQGGPAGGGAVANPDADHVHAILRDPTNEYGARWLAG